jgi:hypothetical protein
VYGLWPVAVSQAEVAAANAVAAPGAASATYTRTPPVTMLKVVGIDVTSIGRIDPQLDDEIVIALEERAEHRYRKLIIADVLDENTSSMKDAFALFIHCIKKGRIGAFVGFIAYLVFSDYRTISKQNKLLQVPEQAIRDMAKRNQLQCEKVKGLTLQISRSNYILSHSSVKSSV